jgi:hypothetical protein
MVKLLQVFFSFLLLQSIPPSPNGGNLIEAASEKYEYLVGRNETGYLFLIDGEPFG